MWPELMPDHRVFFDFIFFMKYSGLPKTFKKIHFPNLWK